MKRFQLIAVSSAFSLMASIVSAQQAAASYTFATRYNEAGQVTGTIAPDPDGAGSLAFRATRSTYGTSGATKGLLIKVETGELASWANETVAPANWSSFAAYLTKTISYDSYGRKSAERVIGSDGFTVEALTQWSYDDWDRVRCKAVRMNKAAFASPPSDPCALGTQGSDGPDRITRYTYNNLDMVLTEERAVGTSLQQTYATNTYAGRTLTSQTDAKGNRTELRYNFKWWLEKRVYPSPNSPGSVNELDYNEYGYDNNGNVTYERKRNTKTITNTFDANNRLIFKNLSDNTYSADVQYNYDLRGLALSSCFGATDSCTASGEGETNVFDGFGNLTSRTSRMGGYARTLSFQHDKEGNRTRVTHPDNNYFTYSFDGLNRMCAIGESIAAPACTSSSAMVRVTYRPSGGRLDLIRPNGTVTNINVDNALRLGSFTQNFSGTTNDLTNGFLYNPARQITRLSQSNSLYSFNQLASRTGTYLSNGLNQISSIAGAALSYDPAGNLTNDAAGMTYMFDMENRLVATAGSKSSTLVSDVLGRLSRITVDGTTTHFQYDGDALVGEYVGTTLTRRYVHGDQVDEPLVQYNSASVGASFRRYLHADHQGSIIAHSDNFAAVPVLNKYDPYGIPATANEGRFGYTGQAWLKEIGLNYYKARMYSPKLGRFLQTDPIYYADDMNLYAYVGGDPVGRTDPLGLFIVSEPDRGMLNKCESGLSFGCGGSASFTQRQEFLLQSTSEQSDPVESRRNDERNQTSEAEEPIMWAYAVDVEPAPLPTERLPDLFHPEKVFVDFATITVTAGAGLAVGTAVLAPRAAALATPDNVRALAWGIMRLLSQQAKNVDDTIPSRPPQVEIVRPSPPRKAPTQGPPQ